MGWAVQVVGFVKIKNHVYSKVLITGLFAQGPAVLFYAAEPCHCGERGYAAAAQAP